MTGGNGLGAFSADQQRTERQVLCPYCWQTITVLIEPGDAGCAYVEDCWVCCRPILFDVHVGADGGLLVETRSEDD